MSDERRPGRPREFDHDAALAAAAELFWERGFGGVSASDLAGAMGIGRSSLYNAFGDRETVFREALEAYLRRAPDAVLAELAPDEPVVPALWKTFRELCRVRAADARARGCLAVNTLAELGGSGTELGEESAERVRGRIAGLDVLLRRAEERGELEPLPDRRRTAEALATFLVGINVMSKAVRSEKALWRICVTTLTGLGLPPPPGRRR